VSADGRRFLRAQASHPGKATTRIEVVLNVQAELQKAAAATW